MSKIPVREALRVTALVVPNSVERGLPVRLDVEWLGKVMTSDNQGITGSRMHQAPEVVL